MNKFTLAIAPRAVKRVTDPICVIAITGSIPFSLAVQPPFRSVHKFTLPPKGGEGGESVH